jgi:hypothetical protein
MPIRILPIILLFGFFSHDVFGQNEYSYDFPAVFDLNHHILIGSTSGKRVEQFDHQISIHYLSTIIFKRYDMGLGVGFENEKYFYLLPTYFHFSYNPWKKNNLPRPYANVGMAFNSERDISLSNSIPGILLSGGIKHSIQIGKNAFLQIKLGYRYQETSTLRLQPSFGSPTAPPNETLVKHKMHRINTLIGIRF